MKPENINILLIDDNPKNLQVAMNILDKEGYNLIYAQDGLKGIELAKKNSFDLILLDVMMPQMDGYTVCQKLKSDVNIKDIPIIFLTVKDDEKDIVEGFNCGGVDYVTKPFYTSVLLKRVETHLKLSHTTKALLQLNQNLNNEVALQVEKIRFKDQVLHQQAKMAAIGEMIANIAHQWRQPLGAISSAIIGMKMKFALNKFDLESKSGREECLKFIDKRFNDIEEYVHSLSVTIDDFRNFFKPQKYEEKFNLQDVVNQSVKLLNANFYNIDIEIINKTQSIQMSGFSNELAQVVINILNNARDAMLSCETNQKKLIIISSKQENKYVDLSIQDCGGGIKDDIIDKIFEPYFTTKHSAQGTGIGLYMCKEIIAKHMQGEIVAKNQSFTYDGNEYFGANFSIKIPIIL